MFVPVANYYKHTVMTDGETVRQKIIRQYSTSDVKPCTSDTIGGKTIKTPFNLISSKKHTAKRQISVEDETFL